MKSSNSFLSNTYKMKLLLLATLLFVAEAGYVPSIPGQFVFTSNVYKELRKSNPGNFVVSPLSVEIILALIRDGAKGNTAKQLSEGLHLPKTASQVQEIFRKVIPTLKKNKNYNLTTANKVYHAKTFHISDTFKKTAVEVYNAEVEGIDFSASIKAANKINKWVKAKTYNLIKNLVKYKDLSTNVALVLVNALYFKGKWVQSFEFQANKHLPFYVNKKNKIETQVMIQTNIFKYYESAELKAKILEMPYEGDDVTMTIVLPNDIEGLSALEDKIESILLPVTRKSESEKVTVVLPKFTTKSAIKFKPILQSLGIVEAFDDCADFSGIDDHNKNLKISDVFQKVLIEVNEHGTTAAAATSVISWFKTANKPKQFFATHPFIYYLSTRSNTILFVGRYTKP